MPSCVYRELGLTHKVTEKRTAEAKEFTEKEIGREKILCMKATWHYIVNSRQSQIKLSSGQK